MTSTSVDHSMGGKFQVRLTRYNRSWTFPRQRYLQLFPDSLFAVALTDPDASVIDIDNPLVTPDILSYLQFITTYPYTPPRRGVDVKSVWAYLNIPVFRIAHNPSIITHPHWVAGALSSMTPNLLDAKSMAKPGCYWRLTHNAALKNDLEVLDYVFERVSANVTKDADIRLMYEAVINGWPQVFTRLLNRGVDVRRDVLPPSRYSGETFMELLPEKDQYYNPDSETTDCDLRPETELFREIRHLTSDQLPFLMLLAPRTMSPGHQAILTETLRRGLLDDPLLLRMVSQYIQVGNPLEEVVLQLYKSIQQFPTDAVDVYDDHVEPLVNRGLAAGYTYLREERKLADPNELANAAALNLPAYLNLDALQNSTEHQQAVYLLTAINHGHYEMGALIGTKLPRSAKQQLLTRGYLSSNLLHILSRDPDITPTDLETGMQIILRERPAGSIWSLIAYLEFDPTLARLVQNEIEYLASSEIPLEKIWRHTLIDFLQEQQGDV